MTKLRSKLLNRKGETLTELLVSVLIGALATMMLATTIANSIQTTKNVDAGDIKLREDITAAQMQDSASDTGKVVITNEAGGSTSVEVNYYGNTGLKTFKPKN